MPLFYNRHLSVLPQALGKPAPQLSCKELCPPLTREGWEWARLPLPHLLTMIYGEGNRRKEASVKDRPRNFCF